MSIEVGAVFGLNHVWRDKTEQWHEDCIGTRKKQGAAVMCWGMISWSWKGPFYVWSAETKEEKAEAAHTIAELNAKGGAEEKRLNDLWRQSEEWKLSQETELDEARVARIAGKAIGQKVKTTQSWRGKKYKIKKLERGDSKGVDSWRYVQVLCKPLLWPTCKERGSSNPQFRLMEDNAPSHDSDFTNREREKFGVEKVDWPPNSPDFNPIERIWWLMKHRILRRRGSEKICTPVAMAVALKEEWDRITIGEINQEIVKLPKIMENCIRQSGGNKFQA